MPPTLSLKASDSAAYANRAAITTLEQYEKFMATTKRTGVPESDEDFEIDSTTVQPGGKRRKTDGADHSQLYRETEKFTNKLDRNQHRDEVLNSVHMEIRMVLEQNDAFRKQNKALFEALMKQSDASQRQYEASLDALRKQNEAFRKQNGVLLDTVLKQGAVILDLADTETAHVNPRTDNSNQT